MKATADQILDAAEAMMREGGYHAFSFREIATELSIKSASVHYHFPTKEMLGNAVAERYLNNFLAALEEPGAHDDPLERYVQVFQQAMETDGRACLCGILAAEAGRLPETIRETLREFAERNIEWLESALAMLHPRWTRDRKHAVAQIVFSTLEGAMIFACLNADTQHLDRVGSSLKTLVVA